MSCWSAALPKATGSVSVVSAFPGISLLLTDKCQSIGVGSVGSGMRDGSRAGWQSAACCTAAAQYFPRLALPGRPPSKGAPCPQWSLLPSCPCEFICWAPFLVSWCRAREALRQCLPDQLKDTTFAQVLKDDTTTKRWLAQLVKNLQEGQVTDPRGIPLPPQWLLGEVGDQGRNSSGLQRTRNRWPLLQQTGHASWPPACRTIQPSQRAAL